jgi:hypothetical protein
MLNGASEKETMSHLGKLAVLDSDAITAIR